MLGPVDSTPDAVLIDCHHAGISGDMLLGALIDLGANQTRIAEEIGRCTAGTATLRMIAGRVRKVD